MHIFKLLEYDIGENFRTKASWRDIIPKAQTIKTMNTFKKFFFQFCLTDNEKTSWLRESICKPTCVMKDSDLDYIINSQNSTLKKASNSIRKWAKGTKGYITEEAIQL